MNYEIEVTRIKPASTEPTTETIVVEKRKVDEIRRHFEIGLERALLAYIGSITYIGTTSMEYFASMAEDKLKAELQILEWRYILISEETNND